MRLLVDPPAHTPLSFGLLSVVDMPTPQDHWQNGIIYLTNCGMGGITYDPCLVQVPDGAGGVEQPDENMPPAPPSKEQTGERVLRAATPFTTIAAFSCAPVGEAEHARIAERELLRSEGWQVERAFWTGHQVNIETDDDRPLVHPHLAASAAVDDGSARLQTAADVVGTGLDPAVGLGLLEQALGDCYGGVGVVHVPLLALETLQTHNLVRRDGSQLYTTAGHRVAAGAGYAGTGPTGTAAGEGTAWLYATGAVMLLRGPVTNRAPRSASEAARFDRATNTVHSIAERTNLLAWECCHVAVNITLGV